MTNVTHYEMTRQEALAIASNNWIDPKDFAQHPWMLCRTGDGHALGTRREVAVTCPACKELLKQRGLL